MTNGTSHIGNWKDNRGFTLIEMLVVFAIIGTLTVVGVNSFFTYGNSQTFKGAVSGVSHALTTTRAQAIAQVKPAVCGLTPLQGYQFSFPTGGGATYYQISVQCGGALYVLSTTNLPQNVTFTTASGTSTFFNSATGIVPAANTITISGYGSTSTITINTTGVISVQ